MLRGRVPGQVLPAQGVLSEGSAGQPGSGGCLQSPVHRPLWESTAHGESRPPWKPAVPPSRSAASSATNSRTLLQVAETQAPTTCPHRVGPKEA